jgi:hypothetical protein
MTLHHIKGTLTEEVKPAAGHTSRACMLHYVSIMAIETNIFSPKP